MLDSRWHKALHASRGRKTSSNSSGKAKEHAEATSSQIAYVSFFLINLHIVCRDKGALDEDEARRLFQQLVVAMDYCHQMGVVNRQGLSDSLKGNFLHSEYSWKSI